MRACPGAAVLADRVRLCQDISEPIPFLSAIQPLLFKRFPMVAVQIALGGCANMLSRNVAA